jgi:hypothetical protein
MPNPPRAHVALECRCGGYLTLSVAQARTPVERLCPRCGAPLEGASIEDRRKALREVAAEQRGKNRGLK